MSVPCHRKSVTRDANEGVGASRVTGHVTDLSSCESLFFFK